MLPMANSIALSTDMETLYFVETNGTTDTTEFSLTTTNGVIIETNAQGEVAVSEAASQLTNNPTNLDIDPESQWQAAFHPNNTTAVFIGNVDIEAGRVSVHSFDISGTKQINLRHEDNQLKITTS